MLFSPPSLSCVRSQGEGAAVMYHQKTNKFVPMDARGSVSLLPRSGLSRRQAEKVAFHVVIFSQDYETLEREVCVCVS